MTADQQPVPGGSGAGSPYCNECGEPPSNHTEVQRKLHGLASGTRRLRCRDCARAVGDAHTVVNPDHQVETIGSGAGSTVEPCTHPQEARRTVGRPGDLWVSCSLCHHEVREPTPWETIAQLKAALEAAQGEIEQWKRVARIEQERADVLFARTQMNNEVFKRQNADLAQARARISEAERMALSIIPDKSAHWLCAPADCNYSRILHALSADGLMP